MPTRLRIRTIALTAAIGVAIALTGCGQEEPAGEPAVEIEAPAVDDERDGFDCESTFGDDERTAKETPDCGRWVKGRWVEWTWVKDGRTTPPPGWSEAKERAGDTAKPTAGPKKPSKAPTKKSTAKPRS